MRGRQGLDLLHLRDGLGEDVWLELLPSLGLAFFLLTLLSALRLVDDLALRSLATFPEARAAWRSSRVP